MNLGRTLRSLEKYASATTYLSGQDVRDLHHLFNFYDVEQEGLIEAHHMRKLGLETPDDIKAPRTCTFTVEEFFETIVAAMQTHEKVASQDSTERVNRAFRMIDLKHEDVVDRTAVTAFLHGAGIKFTDAELSELMETVDRTGDGFAFGERDLQVFVARYQESRAALKKKQKLQARRKKREEAKDRAMYGGDDDPPTPAAAASATTPRTGHRSKR